MMMSFRAMTVLLIVFLSVSTWSSCYVMQIDEHVEEIAVQLNSKGQITDIKPIGSEEIVYDVNVDENPGDDSDKRKKRAPGGDQSTSASTLAPETSTNPTINNSTTSLSSEPANTSMSSASMPQSDSTLTTQSAPTNDSDHSKLSTVKETQNITPVLFNGSSTTNEYSKGKESITTSTNVSDGSTGKGDGYNTTKLDGEDHHGDNVTSSTPSLSTEWTNTTDSTSSKSISSSAETTSSINPDSTTPDSTSNLTSSTTTEPSSVASSVILPGFVTLVMITAMTTKLR